MARVIDEKVKYILDHYLDRIREHLEPSEVWIWGSRVYGTPDEFSDIDMIIVSNRFEGQSFFQRRELFRRLIGVHKDPEAEVVDVLCYTPAEFAELRSQPTVVREAAEKGLKVA